MSSNEIKYWVGFNQLGCIGFQRLSRLLKYFGSLQLAWQASAAELKQAGLEPSVIQQLLKLKNQVDLDAEMEKLSQLGIGLTTVQDQAYPSLLKHIYSPPPLLYHLGKLDVNTSLTLAVVGSRQMTSYGQQVTLELVQDLAQAGFTIVSGLALGIDATAHKAALKAKGKTISVLGSGLAQIYPQANYQLAQDIVASNGAVVSEFPLNYPVRKNNFPQRNRVIAGLCLGTLVTQAAAQSGALITAYCALEQNREVLAVPGSITDPNQAGTNRLIKAGAKVVTCAADVIEALELTNWFD